MAAGAEAAPKRTALVFGGSFNPPHVSHVLAVAWALSCTEAEEVLVVPVYQHPFAKELVSFEHRLAMCELAMGWIPGAIVSPVERELGGESRTLRTIEHLATTMPSRRLRLLVGADVLADLPKWHRFDRIAELAPPIVLGRAGVEDARAPAPLLPAVSSTEVRAALGRGEIDPVRHLVSRSVLEYVERHGLYRAEA